VTTAFLVGVALTALATHAFGYFRWGSRPTDLERGAVPAYRLDLNHADRTALMQVPGVGEHLATRIEDHRASHGPYRKVDDLRAVKGVGPATLERLRDWVEVDAEKLSEEMDEVELPDAPPPAFSKKSPPPSSGKSGAKKKAPPDAPIDINKAGIDELQKLPDIGPAFAQRIIDERKKKPFEKVEDLTRVPGIKERRLETLRPYVTVKSPPPR
jgi:competence protein ComEA